MTCYADSSFLVSCYIVGSRSLDILHIAAAKSLRTAEFATFDTRQRALASAVNLKVFP